MFVEVARDDLHRTRIVDPPARPPAPGQVSLSVERFALTTNNITYAVAGDMLDYWGFFPTDEGWGRLPVMGIGTVTTSAVPAVEPGSRYFGFFPLGDRHLVTAEPRGRGFRDVGAHRRGHAAAYTDFRAIDGDPAFAPERVDLFLLLWGMFTTAFLIDDQIAEEGFRDAERILITSASSKTSISLASCLARRSGCHAVGLTSTHHRAFVASLGLYDEVVTYDEIETLDPSVRSGLVDMAGSATVRGALHRHLGDHLDFSLSVGVTHWQDADMTGNDDLPGPTPEFFFAPARRARRVADWGAEELDARIDAAFAALVDDARRWLRVEHRVGPAAVEATYRELLEGRADPAVGFVCSFS